MGGCAIIRKAMIMYLLPRKLHLYKNLGLFSRVIPHETLTFHSMSEKAVKYVIEIELENSEFRTCVR